MDSTRQFVSDHRKGSSISDTFEQVGGNTELADARIVFLGNRHTNEVHSVQNAQLIDSIAEDGDIVLVEEIQANQEIKKKEYEYTKLISKEVRVFGWDDKISYDKAVKDAMTLFTLYDKMKEAHRTNNEQESNTIYSQFVDLNKEMKDLTRKRNEKLS